MSLENPLWGAPRVHGELLKLGFEVSQSTVAKYMPKRHGRPPGQSWWTFLRNHAPEIAAMDLFVVPTLAFRLLYGFIIVRLDRRELVWIAVTRNPTADWIARQLTEAFPWDFSTGLSDPRSGPRLRSSRLPADACNGHPGQTYCISFALAERICRATDWVYSPRMSRSRDHWRRSTLPSRTGNVRAILQRGAHAPVARKSADRSGKSSASASSIPYGSGAAAAVAGLMTSLINSPVVSIEHRLELGARQAFRSRHQVRSRPSDRPNDRATAHGCVSLGGET